MSAQAAWGLEEKPLDALEKVPQDQSWISCLPPGSKILGMESSGAFSFWSRTARIDTQLPDGKPKSYFFKVMNGERGKLMAHGEYESMLALYNTSPQCIPKPIGCGTFERDPNNHFFICDFLDLADEIPDPISVCKSLADLHHKSIASWGPDMFGFDVVTCNGTFPQDNRWSKSWEAFFAQQMKGALEADEFVHGSCDEYSQLGPSFFDKVIPRLLRPLETGGNTTRPCLIHGDLWDGNMSFLADSEQVFFYDASSFWGHNEYDLHNWRGARFRLSKTFVKEYFNHFPISPPQEDWDDRNLLYAIRADVHSSILHRTTTRFRQLVISAMKELVDKFPEGYEGTEQRKDLQGAGEDDSPGVHKTTDNHDSGRDRSKKFDIGVGEPWANQESAGDGAADMQTGNTGAFVTSIPMSPTETASEVRFGESAISPPDGSVVGS